MSSQRDRLEAVMAELEAAIADLSETVGDIGSDAGDHTATMADLEHSIGEVRTASEAQLADMGRRLRSTIATVDALSSASVLSSPVLQAAGPPARLIDERLAVGRVLNVWVVMNHLRLSTTTFDHTCVSVITRTLNRVDYLAQAVSSVFAQRHRNFELIVVDDGSTDGTADFLAGIEDSRLRVVRTSGAGAAGAANRGLEAAQGDLVTYLDDDNIMDPGWLHAVTWAFDRWPDKQLLYGARVIEDAPAGGRQASGAMPSLEWDRFDRRRLEHANYIDMNVIAHRSGLPRCRLDESASGTEDWDLMLTLTAMFEPLELPAIACLYRSYAPNRVSDRPVRHSPIRRIRSKVHTTRPMRILSPSFRNADASSSESLFDEAMSALERAGAKISYALGPQPEPPPHGTPRHLPELAEAVAAFDPDLIFWRLTPQGADWLPALERTGRPFALAVDADSFEVGVNLRVVHTLYAHRNCVGMWTYGRPVPALSGARNLTLGTPERGRQFHTDVSDALEAWRLAVG